MKILRREILFQSLLVAAVAVVSGAAGVSARRMLYYPVSNDLVSDGVDDRGGSTPSYLELGMRLGEETTSEGKCEQMYGFLPCSVTSAGHLFLIVVYEYLLFHGESYVASGGERMFKILGPGVFGASAFQLIGSLPEASILLASGLLNSKEVAQECVQTGIGLLAGSTILLLTIVWGTCVLLGSQNIANSTTSDLHSSPSPRNKQNFLQKFFSKSTVYGVETDKGACYIGIIMLISVIPFLVFEIPRIFKLSSFEERALILFTLVISIGFLLTYFFYQVFKPWIQRRQLEYIKHEHLVVGVLKHLQDQTMGSLLTPNGAPNTPAIRRIFDEKDSDGDKLISTSELKEFLQNIRFRNLELDKDITTAEMMKEFDMNHDDQITVDEFVNGVSKWLDETKNVMEKRMHTSKSLKDLYQVLQPWIQKKMEERELMKHLVPKILEHLQGSVHGRLVREDGTPDIPAIKRLFEDIDDDKNGYISESELKEHMTSIKYGGLSLGADETATKIMNDLDMSGDKLISLDEFITGLSKWLNMANSHDAEEHEDDMHTKSWEQTDKLLDNKSVHQSSSLAWMKATTFLALGVIILGLLAEPLIHSVQNLSSSARIPSFFISFILVPLATNTRIAVSAITEARRKKKRIISLTLSEIYSVVFMNNVLGFIVLLSLIYFRGLTWSFSAEVLVVVVVCIIVGCLTSFSTIIPAWTSILAYLLYPLSLVLVYVLERFVNHQEAYNFKP